MENNQDIQNDTVDPVRTSKSWVVIEEFVKNNDQLIDHFAESKRLMHEMLGLRLGISLSTRTKILLAVACVTMGGYVLASAFAGGFSGLISLVMIFAFFAVPASIVFSIVRSSIWYTADSYLEYIFWTRLASSLDLTLSKQESLLRGNITVLAEQPNTTSESVSFILTGEIEKHIVRTYLYERYEKQGKNNTKKTSYLIAEIEFKSQFPQIVLDRHILHRVGELIEVRGLEKYAVSVMRGYEVDALQLLSEDVCAYINDNGLDFDIEIVDNKIVFEFCFLKDAEQYVQSDEKTDLTAQKVTAVIAFIKDFLKEHADTYDSYIFSKVGDRPYIV